MPGIDLSTLSGSELRRLLKVARDREDAALADQLRAELTARDASGQPGPAAPLPRIEAVEASGRMSWRGDPEPNRAAAAYGRPRIRSLPMAALGVAVGGLAITIAGWSVMERREAPPPPAAAAPPRAMAALAPTPGQEAAKHKAAHKPAAHSRRASEPRPERVATAEPAVRVPLRTNDPCSSPPTPADRLVCSDLGLAELHRQMREAYRKALNARADPYVVGPAQDAWRRARDPVSDPQRLAQLYDRRIRELNAAAAAARAEQPPF